MSTSIQELLEFRTATEADLVAVTGLLTQLNRAEGNPTIMNVDDLRRGLFGENRRVPLRALLATRNEAVVAAALYYTGYDILTSVHGYHLGDLVVDEAQRGQGIGRALFAALAQQNLAEEGEWISLTALSHNAKAVAFYQALGMVHVPVEFFAAGKIILRTIITSVAK